VFATARCGWNLARSHLPVDSVIRPANRLRTSESGTRGSAAGRRACGDTGELRADRRGCGRGSPRRQKRSRQQPVRNTLSGSRRRRSARGRRPCSPMAGMHTRRERRILPRPARRKPNFSKLFLSLEQARPRLPFMSAKADGVQSLRRCQSLKGSAPPNERGTRRPPRAPPTSRYAADAVSVMVT
jgi:hypothetical protein